MGIATAEQKMKTKQDVGSKIDKLLRAIEDKLDT